MRRRRGGPHPAAMADTGDGWAKEEGGADPAAAPAPAVPALEAALTGVYRRTPVENGWHVGQITQPVADDASEATSAPFLWTNDAGVSWTLDTTEDPNVLRTDKGNPYHDTSPEFFVLRDDKGNVHGLEFNKEVYQRDGKDSKAAPAAPPPHPLEGTFRRFPIENEWHVGQVAPDDSGADGVASAELRWTNDAGVSWALQPTDDPNVFRTGPTNPYIETIKMVHLERSAEDEVLGFKFGDDFYRLADRHPLEGVYRREPCENGWHEGTIAAVEGPAEGPADGLVLPPLMLQWTNKAGAGWFLGPTDDPDVFETGESNPYRDACSTFTVQRSEMTNRIIGFKFVTDTFVRLP